MNWPTENDFSNYIKDMIIGEIYRLGIETAWIGDPSTSEFGVRINLTYNGYPIGQSTIIDFVGKTD